MILRIGNTPRPYNWGSRHAIADLLGTTASGEPEAELWLGAHPGSPSRILDGAAEGDLAAWVQVHRPDGRLPFLMKVLAASAPLSLQAHPTPQQAREGFERENAAGIPLHAAHRNYKDPFHKPELLYALSHEFRALSGFRPVEISRAELAAVGDARLAPLLDRLSGEESLRPVVEWLIERRDGVNAVIAALTEHAAATTTLGESWDTVRRLSAGYPGDPGIAVSTLMHTVVLRAGEAIYLPAGNIHAYLEGLGIEVMAASDNVLRGGLTPKHVDVHELMRVLDFRSLPVPYLLPKDREPGVSIFTPEVPDFRLAVVRTQPGRERILLPTQRAAIALVLEGTIDITVGDETSRVERGGAVFVDSGAVHVHGDGHVVVAWSEQ